jgi:hypothetical protein
VEANVHDHGGANVISSGGPDGRVVSRHAAATPHLGPRTRLANAQHRLDSQS